MQVDVYVGMCASVMCDVCMWVYVHVSECDVDVGICVQHCCGHTHAFMALTGLFFITLQWRLERGHRREVQGRAL